MAIRMIEGRWRAVMVMVGIGLGFPSPDAMAQAQANCRRKRMIQKRPGRLQVFPSEEVICRPPSTKSRPAE